MKADIGIIGTITEAFKRNQAGAIMGFLVFGNIFFAGMWRDEARRANNCYDDKVMQERRHGDEREKVHEKIIQMSYTIGELKAMQKSKKK